MISLIDPLLPYTGYLALFLRVVVGATMMLHGYPKLKSKEQSVSWMKSLGMPGSTAVLASILEFFGGLFLIIGLIVPIVALFFAIQFLSITLMKKIKMKSAYVSPGKPSYEIDVTYLLLSLVLIFLGSGMLSLDKLIGL